MLQIIIACGEAAYFLIGALLHMHTPILAVFYCGMACLFCFDTLSKAKERKGIRGVTEEKSYESEDEANDIFD